MIDLDRKDQELGKVSEMIVSEFFIFSSCRGGQGEIKGETHPTS